MISLSSFLYKATKKVPNLRDSDLTDHEKQFYLHHHLFRKLFVPEFMVIQIFNFQFFFVYSNLSEYKYTYMCVMENKNIKSRKVRDIFDTPCILNP